LDNPSIIIKKELLKIPLWGQFANRIGLIGIDRSAGAKALESLEKGARAILETRRCLVIFPEGTRVPAGQHRPYRSGISRMYQLTGLPIVPVALNSGLFWPKSILRRRGGTITMQVLEEIPAGLEPKEALRLLESRLNAASDVLLKEET
jgi:1-acyl-sn-glycerol-3-phosphate acyltransferase